MVLQQFGGVNAICCCSKFVLGKIVLVCRINLVATFPCLSLAATVAEGGTGLE
jgi:hypothetical protein